MTRNVVRSAAVALLLSLAALTATPAHAAAPAAPVLNPGDVLQQIWGWVTSIFGEGEEAKADHGCGIDPNGGCAGKGESIDEDHGCGIDPNGRPICG